jgi:hypothetical protein
LSDPMSRAKYGAPLEWIGAHSSCGSDECLPWPFCVTPKGYGQVRIGGRLDGAHRVMCGLVYGPAPSGMEVAHSCGNRACCNPRHLRYATSSENKQDKLLHGTHQGGERNPRSKLTAAAVRDIRTRRACGEARSVLAAEYGVSPAAVRQIDIGRTWAGIANRPPNTDG